MRSFSDCLYQEFIQRCYSLLSRTNLLHPAQHAPARCLLRFCDALGAGDMGYASRSYHDLMLALLDSPARRVSGELWRDYILYALLETPHRYARIAAEGIRDEAADCAMKAELTILGELFTLSGDLLSGVARDTQRELKQKAGRTRDNISAMSTAVWLGASTRPLPKETEAPAPPQSNAAFELAFCSFTYGEAGIRGEYVADEALEEVYARLLESTDWPSLNEDIWNFFASYGCGDFIKRRTFCYANGALSPLELPSAPLCAVRAQEAQRDALLSNAIRHMRGEPSQNMLITGGAGTGKTALALSLAQELPELRLVLCCDTENLRALTELLSKQPLRFMVLLDDVVPDSKEIRRALSSVCALPQNVKLCFTARELRGECAFAARISLQYLTLSDFTTLCGDILKSLNRSVDPSTLKNACVDYQVDAREQLTPAGARHVAEQLLS